jgi:hypothetical protein
VVNPPFAEAMANGFWYDSILDERLLSGDESFFFISLSASVFSFTWCHDAGDCVPDASLGTQRSLGGQKRNERSGLCASCSRRQRLGGEHPSLGIQNPAVVP